MEYKVQASRTNGLVRWTVRTTWARRVHQDQRVADGGSIVLILKKETEGAGWNGGDTPSSNIAADKDSHPPGTTFAGGHCKSRYRSCELEKKLKAWQLGRQGKQKVGPLGSITTTPVVGSRPRWSLALSAGDKEPNPSNPIHRVPRITVTRTEEERTCPRHAQVQSAHAARDGIMDNERILHIRETEHSPQVVACSTPQRKRTPNATTLSPATSALPLPPPPMTQARRPLLSMSVAHGENSIVKRAML